MKSDLLEILLESELHTLLHDKNLQVLNVQDIKIVFSKNRLLAYAKDQILYVKPNYFKGGQNWNGIVQMEFELVMQTYQLKAIEPIAVLNPQLDRLKEIFVLIENETDTEKATALVEEAAEIAEELASPEAAKLFTDIGLKGAENLKLMKPGDIQVYQELTKRFHDIVSQVDNLAPAILLQRLNEVVKWAGMQTVEIPEFKQQLNQLEQMLEILKSSSEEEFKQKLMAGFNPSDKIKIAHTSEEDEEEEIDPDSTEAQKIREQEIADIRNKGKKKLTGTALLKDHPMLKKIEIQSKGSSKPVVKAAPKKAEVKKAAVKKSAKKK